MLQSTHQTSILRRKTEYSLGLLAMLALSLNGCGAGKDEALLGDFADNASASAAFYDSNGKAVGQAAFAEGPHGVLMRVDMKGLAQGWHGIHFHQKSDCSDNSAGFKASGGHVDPGDIAHGLMNPKGHEVGDLSNLYAGADGRATAEFFIANTALHPSEEAAANFGAGNILLDDDGFAVVIHEGPDDHQSQPIGGAGARVACAALISG
jgi:superoxide dismutase, Cu-Zn family